MDEFDLDKASVRGKRSNRGATKKKFERRFFDDEQLEHQRKQAGKRKHSRHYDVEYDDVIDTMDDYEDNPYADLINPKLIK